MNNAKSKEHEVGMATHALLSALADLKELAAWPDTRHLVLRDFELIIDACTTLHSLIIDLQHEKAK